MWIRPAGFTPIDGPAVRVGDPRHDEDCANRSVPSTIPTELGAILATIRQMESGGDYTAQARGSTASGAYQFIDSTWNGYGGYRRAADAPPPVQDAKAVEFATAILERHGGDVAAIPVTWYIGRVPVGAEYDRVPRPDAGNRLTPREYQQRWLALYEWMLGQPGQWDGGSAEWQPLDTSSTCRTVVVELDEPSDLALTQAQGFAVDATGRAVVRPADPCDPQRGAETPGTPGIAERSAFAF
jgi:hypothetical protein